MSHFSLIFLFFFKKFYPNESDKYVVDEINQIEVKIFRRISLMDKCPGIQNFPTYRHTLKQEVRTCATWWAIEKDAGFSLQAKRVFYWSRNFASVESYPHFPLLPIFPDSPDLRYSSAPERTIPELEKIDVSYLSCTCPMSYTVEI